ncbi:helix-turn-helix domain-containing protein [Streptomyces sp. NBC_00210]|uniref:helix-turn-helix domain-containing protein n=1 Tax=Streptomyces sp. NBC_00210 TaxID=2903636 RepID=UPI003254EA3C
MAEQQLNAPPRALSVVHETTTGVIQVHEYQADRYTIVGNHLAQHTELSLTAIGLATHILSLPNGSQVDIRTLAERFPEGRDRITAALQELEEHGYVQRVLVRTAKGQLVTRTYAFSDPKATRTRLAREAEDEPRPAHEPVPERPARELEPEPHPAAEPVRSSVTTALLTDLRRHDARLLLSERDVHGLAPLVGAWLERGIAPDDVRRAITASLPPDLRNPVGLLRHRLTTLLPPPLAAAPATARPAPLQNCDHCDRAFRATGPGRCRDCRPPLAQAA